MSPDGRALLASSRGSCASEDTVISPHVVEPADEPVARAARRRGPARRGGAGRVRAAWSRRSARATCCTTATPRLLAGHDADLALLAGDYLYALGLERLAALGDPEAVAELSDLISLSAACHAEGVPRRPSAALWLAAAIAVGCGGCSGTRRQGGSAPSTARRRRAAAGSRRRRPPPPAGSETSLDRAAESIDFARSETG